MSLGGEPFRFALCNLEFDGGGGRSPRWEGCHDLLSSLNLDLLLRQEMTFSVDESAPDRKGELLKAAEERLGMRGFAAPARPGTNKRSNYCGIFIREPDMEFEEEHKVTAPWQPCYISVRLNGGAPWEVASFHAAYNSPPERAMQGYWLTRLPDRVGRWAAFGGDCNSTAEPFPGEAPGSPATDIQDKPHVAHRFVEGPDGQLVRDTELDRIVRRAGMADVARIMAERGKLEALRPTAGYGRRDQGSERRIDRLYVPEEWSEALTDVEVVDNPYSDHRIVVASFDRTKLTEITSGPPPSHAERIRWAQEAGTTQAVGLKNK